MTSADAGSVVLVGAGQLSSRRADESPPPGPADLIAEAVALAAADTGRPEAIHGVDTIVSIPVHPWRTTNPAAEVAGSTGIAATRLGLTGNGGQAGVAALNWAAEEIMAGRCRAVLLVGANVLRTVDRAAQRGENIEFAGTAESTPEQIFGFRPDGSSPEEQAVGLDVPIRMYPLFENALRAWRGQSLGEHRAFMGRLFSRFTEVAAQNPAAWFPVARTAEELVTVTGANRMISFPYPKYLNSVLSTDQAAAVLVAAPEWADQAGIDKERWVHWWGGAEAVEQAWFVSTRPDLADAPAMRHAHRTALANAGITVDDVSHFDFYSCFPAAVEMALKVLGLDPSDPRNFTVTGGLPYAGGPGSAYTLHSLAGMYSRLRSHPGDVGMVTGNGWYLTKHSAAVLSTRPPASPPTSATPDIDERQRAAVAPLPLRRSAGTSEAGRVDSYTVFHERNGTPAKGIVVGRFADGARFVANTAADPVLLAEMEGAEMVGRTGSVSSPAEAPLRFDPD